MPEKTFYLELPSDASPTVALAARELSRAVGEIFGWRETPGRAEGAHRLRLGTRRTSFAFRSFLNEVMRPLGDDGFRIVADSTTTTFCAETDKGLLNAAYTFLAAVLRMKWVEPGASGEVKPRREVRPWWPMDLVEAPSFAIRGLHVGAPDDDFAEADATRLIEWLARNRLNHLALSAGDGYERLRRVVADECRLRGVTLELELPPPAPACASGRGAAEAYAKACVAWVAAHPEVELANLAPGEPCACKPCREISAAERWSRFLYPALAALRTEFPDRQFASRVGPAGYETLEPDAECRLGVATVFDTSARCPWHELGSDLCEVTIGGEEAESGDGPSRSKTGTVPVFGRVNYFLLDALKAWKALATAPMIVLESAFDARRPGRAVVNFEPLSRDAMTFRSLGVAGLMLRVDPRAFGTFLLNAKLFARLAWNVDANWRGIWPDLCIKYFGGYSMRVMDFVERLRERGEGEFSEAELARLDGLMGPAFEGENDLFAQRYERVRKEFLRLRALAPKSPDA